MEDHHEIFEKSIETANKRLDEIIEKYDSIISSSDRKNIAQISEAIQIKKQEISAEFNHGVIDKLNPVSLSKYDEKVLTKICAQAEYFQKNGCIRYEILDKYLTIDEVKEKIVSYLNSEFISQDSMRILYSISRYIDSKKELSSKQTVLVEKIFNFINPLQEIKEKGGAVMIYRGWKREDMGYIAKIINFGISKKLSNDFLQAEQFWQLREKFLTSEGTVNLSELEKNIFNYRRPNKNKRKEKSIKDSYVFFFRKLEEFLSQINPESHEINRTKEFGIFYAQGF